MEKHYHFPVRRQSNEIYFCDKKFCLPANIAKYLTNFQLEAVKFVCANFVKNKPSILNDERGLGKTVEVSAFLASIILRDKKYFVVVRNDESIANWLFHLDVLANIQAKVVETESDFSHQAFVYIIKWSTMQKMSLLKYNLEFKVIIDDRIDRSKEDNFIVDILKYHSKNVLLIVVSSDITLDIKYLHSILKLYKKLDKNFTNYQDFEKKFSLKVNLYEKNDNILETYFQRREKIIDFCREFRLRRYQYQFEEDLPLANITDYKKSIMDWKKKNSQSGDSAAGLITLSSESDLDANSLLQKLFFPEPAKQFTGILDLPTRSATDENSNDTDMMSPLIYETDTEETQNLLEKKSSADILTENKLGHNGNNISATVHYSEDTPNRRKENVYSALLSEKTHKKETTKYEKKQPVKIDKMHSSRITRSSLQNYPEKKCTNSGGVCPNKKRGRPKNSCKKKPNANISEKIGVNKLVESDVSMNSEELAKEKSTCDRNVFDVELDLNHFMPGLSSDVQILNPSNTIFSLSSTDDNATDGGIVCNSKLHLNCTTLNKSPELFETPEEYERINPFCNQNYHKNTRSDNATSTKTQEVAMIGSINSLLWQVSNNSHNDLHKLGRQKVSPVNSTPVSSKKNSKLRSPKSDLRSPKITKYFQVQPKSNKILIPPSKNTVGSENTKLIGSLPPESRSCKKVKVIINRCEIFDNLTTLISASGFSSKRKLNF